MLQNKVFKQTEVSINYIIFFLNTRSAPQQCAQGILDFKMFSLLSFTPSNCSMQFKYILIVHSSDITGTDPGFQVRGGALKKIVPRGGRREIFLGISCEKSRFYAPPLGSAPVLMVVYTVPIIHVTQYKRKVARNTKALRLIMRTTKNLTTNLVYIQTVSIYQYNLKQKVIIKQ